MKKPRVLCYDIETTPLKAWIWRLGDQVLRHDQLDKDYKSYDIICIAYKFNDGKPAKVLHWDYKKQDSSKMIEKFDKIADTADIVFGKNSDRFDVKHINTQRMLSGLPGLPNWLERTDDIEKQFRKNFYFPSQSLDYLSELLGLGGKNEMKFQDWIDIVEKKSKKSYNKMLKYCKKDVDDTMALWNYAYKHFKPKFNMAKFNEDFRCVNPNCGSENIVKNGTVIRGLTRYQSFHCNHHGGFAGRAPIKADGSLGNIR